MYRFVKKWTADIHLRKLLSNTVELYIRQCDETYRELALKIISNVDFYDMTTFKNEVDQYSDKLREFVDENTKIISLVDNQKIHNSGAFLSIANNDGCEIIYYSKNDFNNVNSSDFCYNLIIVDDYSGSLTSFKKFLDEFHKLIKTKLNNEENNLKSKIEITFFPLFITTYALKVFYEIQNEYELFNLNIKCITEIRKASFIINNSKLTTDEKSLFEQFNEYLKIPESYRYGFNNVEDIIVFHYFVPNNTLGFLWYRHSAVPPIFGRKSGFKGTNDSEIIPIKLEKYFKSLIKNKGKSKSPYFVILLLCGYDENKIEKIMNLSKNEYNKLFNNVLKKDIVVKVDGKIEKTDRIYKYIYYDCLDFYIKMGMLANPEDEMVLKLKRNENNIT